MNGRTRELLAAAGFAAFFAWFVIDAFFIPLLSDDASAGTTLRLAAHTAFFLALPLCSAATMVNARRFERLALQPVVVSMLGACCIPTLLCGWIIPVPDAASTELAAGAILAVPDFLAGVACSCLFTSWHSVGARLESGAFLRYEGLSCAFGSLAAAGMLLAPATAWAPVALVFMTCSTVLLGALCRHAGSIEAGGTEKRSLQHVSGHMDRRFRALFFILNLVFGIAWCMPEPAAGQTCAAMTSAAACALALVLATKARTGVPDRYVLTLMRMGLGVSLVALFMACAGNVALVFAGRCMLIALWALSWVIDNSLLLQQAREFGFSVAEHGGYSKVISCMGLFAGWCVGTACVQAGLFGEELLPLSAAFAVAALALLGAWLIPLDTYESPDAVIAKQAELARKRAEIERPVDEVSTRLNRTAKRYELTNRERDVLVWLMKGRTAKTIAAELEVSEATAKTHIYNIYKKTGVHSQQDLIKLIEEL